MMGIMVPEICWASKKICNKNRLLHLVGGQNHIKFIVIPTSQKTNRFFIIKDHKVINILLKKLSYCEFRTKHFDTVLSAGKM